MKKDCKKTRTNVVNKKMEKIHERKGQDMPMLMAEQDYDNGVTGPEEYAAGVSSISSNES